MFRPTHCILNLEVSTNQHNVSVNLHSYVRVLDQNENYTIYVTDNEVTSITKTSWFKRQFIKHDLDSITEKFFDLVSKRIDANRTEMIKACKDLPTFIYTKYEYQRI